MLGHVPSGLPDFGLPDFGWDDWSSARADGRVIFLVILAQSAATSRAYAAKYADRFDENLDLVGLSLANASAGVSGTFVVNGSPTKTQMVDGAGGKSQLVAAHHRGDRACRAAVPHGAAAVHADGCALVDRVPDRRRARRHPRDAHDLRGGGSTSSWSRRSPPLVVVAVGVEQGILLAIVLSLLDHLRRSYHPRDTLLIKLGSGRWRTAPVPADAATPPPPTRSPGSWSIGSAPRSTTPTRTGSSRRSADAARPNAGARHVDLHRLRGDRRRRLLGRQDLDRPAVGDRGEGLAVGARGTRRRRASRARSVRRRRRDRRGLVFDTVTDAVAAFGNRQARSP